MCYSATGSRVYPNYQGGGLPGSVANLSDLSFGGRVEICPLAPLCEENAPLYIFTTKQLIKMLVPEDASNGAI